MAERSVPPVPTPPLVGREREQRLLRDALTSALGGRGGLVLIGGEAGIGKTALAEAILAEAATQGALVLVGRCYDLSETPPYGPWTEAFERAPRREGLPVLPSAVLSEEREGAPLASQAAIVGRIRDYLVALADRQPVILLLDDLHWADTASLDLLRAGSRRLDETPLLLLGTYRAEEVARPHPLFVQLPLLVREAHAVRIDLRPLDDAAIGALVAGRYALDDAECDRLAAYLASRTEGNPLFLGELLRTLEGEGLVRRDGGRWAVGNLERVPVPTLLRQVLDGRVARLDAESQRLLGVAAVVGHEVSLAVWAAAGEAGEDALLGAVEQGLEARLLVDAPGHDAVRFAHALIREALYEGIPGIRRRRLHRRIGETLAALGSPDPDAVAYHFLQADDGRAAAWLVRAGERAQAAAAWLTAAARFQRAVSFLAGRGLEENAQGWLLVRIAQLCRYAYPERAITHLETAERIARTTGDRALAACAVSQRGLLGCVIGDLARGLNDLRTGEALFDSLPENERARVRNPHLTGGADLIQYGTLALWLAMTGHFAEARPGAERILARRVGEEQAITPGRLDRATAAYCLGFINAALGRLDEARHAFAESRAGYLAAGDNYLAGMTATQELACLLRYRPDDRAGRERLATEAEAVWRQAAGTLDELAPLLVHAPLLFVEGRWDEAYSLTQAVHARSQARWSYVTVAMGLLGVLSRHRGEAAQAWTLVREILPEGPDARLGTTRYVEALSFQELAAALATEAGDLSTARVWLEAHDRWVAWGESVLGQAEGHLGWAAYHRAAGDPAAARRHAEHALAHAAEPRQPLVLLAAHRLLGELNTVDGHQDDAAGHLAKALTLAEACAAPYERALTLLAIAELHLVTGDRPQATAILTEARAILESLEARPALARADALAAPASAPPVREALPFGLTAREAEVLALLAVGLTDRQIAERLYVSRNTVNAHAKAVYGKLGVNNRAAAARLAVARGLTGEAT